MSKTKSGSKAGSKGKLKTIPIQQVRAHFT
jgi:hypothetical protein